MMTYKETTQVPNVIFDQHLTKLTESELKILLVIIRQTYGWTDKRTGGRKAKDRISYGQFMQKTGYSRRTITTAIFSLLNKGLIVISDKYNNALDAASSRRGKYLYFGLKHVQSDAGAYAVRRPEHVQRVAYNKTNYTKEKETKLREGEIKSIGDIIKRRMPRLIDPLP